MGRTSSATLTASERTAFSVAAGSPSMSVAESPKATGTAWASQVAPAAGSDALSLHPAASPLSGTTVVAPTVNRNSQLQPQQICHLLHRCKREVDITPQGSSLQPCPDAYSTSVAPPPFRTPPATHAFGSRREKSDGGHIFAFLISDYANMGAGLPTLLDAVFCLCKTQNGFGSLYG